MRLDDEQKESRLSLDGPSVFARPGRRLDVKIPANGNQHQ